MESISLLIFVSIAIPMLLMCAVLKGRSRTLVLFLLFGVVAAIVSGTVNNYIIRQTDYTRFYVTINIAPAVEEIVKAVPVLIFAFALKKDRQSLLESAIACGLGFAMYENIYLLLQTENLTFSLAMLRGLGAGLVHSICTLAVAFGVSFLVKRRAWFLSGTVALLATAMTFHSLYNILIQSEYMVFGLVLPVCAYIPIAVLSIKYYKNKC